MIRVLLVDDQQLVREGLRRILHPEQGFEIAGSVVTAVRSPMRWRACIPTWW